MTKVFATDFIVTQKFGVNPGYYKQFGLTAHEGLDLIPKTLKSLDVFSLPFPGIIVKDFDMASKGGAYGINCTIWYPQISEAWQFCHLSSNAVYMGQEIPPAAFIGVMGSTGNTKGAHLHLNRFKVDTYGIRLNKNNGYLGGVDPLPFLEETEHRPQAQTAISATEADDRKRALDVLILWKQKHGVGGNLEGFANMLAQDGYRALKHPQIQIKETIITQEVEPTFSNPFASSFYQLAKAIQERADGRSKT